ncbi:hypothetical protein EON79_05355 [bacterium]|nr:MAG: hypothetical protein EON79_05355 [bacterium]
MRRTALLPLALLAATAFAQDPLTKYMYPLAKPLKTPKVIVDTTDIPSLAPWAAKAKVIVEQWYPYLTSMLATEDWKAPREIRLVFKKKIDAPAWAAGNEITFSGEWLTAHPDDMGIVVHELTHIIQSYPGIEGDIDRGWLVEGIADYIRWWRYEPESPRSRVDPAKAKYTDAYRTTAAFLAWTSAKYDRGLVMALDRAFRKRQDPVPEFKRLTGKDVDTLWAEYIATLK